LLGQVPDSLWNGRYEQVRKDFALRPLHALREFHRPREKKLSLLDIKSMFREMKGLIG